MKINYCKLCLWIVLLVGFLVLCAVAFIMYASNISYDNNKHLCGIEFLKRHNLNLYANYYGLYHLDVESEKWKLEIPDIRGDSRQEVVIFNNQIYFFDLEDNCIKKIEMGGKSNAETIMKLDTIPHQIAISYAGKIAYSTIKGLSIYDLQKKEEVGFYKDIPNSISWSLDDNFLFITMKDGIMRLDIKSGSLEKVADGLWAEVFPDNKLGYYDYGRNACFIKDLDTGVETELFKSKEPLIAMDWTPSGRFVVLGYRVRTGLINWGPRPVVVDTETLEYHTLPPFKIHTHILFLQKDSLL